MYLPCPRYPCITTGLQRYAILMHRIQAPEDAATGPSSSPPPPTPAASAAASALRRAAANRRNDLESQQPDLPTPGRQAGEASVNRPLTEASIWREVVTSISNPESKACMCSPYYSSAFDLTRLIVHPGFIAAFIIISLFQITMSSKILVWALFALHSFWLPQIVRNVRKGTRRALRKRYLFTTTLCRSFFLLCSC
jgi:hypothetical protein